jgi:hypothetical protein
MPRREPFSATREEVVAVIAMLMRMDERVDRILNILLGEDDLDREE